MSTSGPARNVVRDDVIVLIGYRGCGKSSVGRRLAEKLGWQFVDTDELVEQQAGCPVREIFARQGAGAFRKLEAEVLAEALSGRGRVISAGGGAVLLRRNRKLLRGTGVCVWLTAPPEVLYQRICADHTSPERRPDLTDLGGLAEVEEVLQQRLPIYEATADHVVSTVDLSVEQVAEAILQRLGVVVPPAGEAR